ncbi:MAG: 3-oxoadipate enol-lactone hydrolase, partial [Frankiales bacterium]|nr:3-oxoadipate enol-lactone hydrolase [Frankiales bacterium]
MRAVSGDVELDYEVRGEGPPLVWLHGLSGSLDESRPLCERLAKDFTVLWYSSRGHGRSSPVHEKDR